MNFSCALPWFLVAATSVAILPSGSPAFSGQGREKLRAAVALLKQKDELGSRQIEGAVRDLLEARKLTTSDDEVDLVASWLGSAYDRQAQAFHREGDHDSAIWRAKEALKLVPDQAAYHLRLGKYQQEAGDYFGASHAFEQAMTLAGDGQRLSYGQWLVSNYMKMGHAGDGRGFSYAVQEIDKLLYDFPDEGTLYTWKAKAQNELGDEEGAAATLSEAKQRGILTESAEKLLEQTSSAAAVKKEGFVQESGLHFTLEFEEGSASEEWSRFLLDTLEAAYGELGYTFDLSPRHTMHVSVYFDDQFEAVFQVPWSGGNASGNRINLNLNPRGAPETMIGTIYHEFAHHLIFLKANQMHVPSWLNEGLAMHMEPDLDPARFHRALHAALRDPAKGPLPFSELDQPFGRFDSEMALRAYAQGYDAVHYLIERSRLSTVMALLDELRSGDPFEEVFRRTTSITWPDFEREWLAWRLEQIESSKTGPDTSDLISR